MRSLEPEANNNAWWVLEIRLQSRYGFNIKSTDLKSKITKISIQNTLLET